MPRKDIRHDRWNGGLEPGDYGKDEKGTWYGVPPGTDLLANLGGHKIVENEDGTITVTPSILVGAGPDQKPWHGYLTAGIWKEC